MLRAPNTHGSKSIHSQYGWPCVYPYWRIHPWERFGAGGKQHNRSGAVLASTGGTGRGRLPVPSPVSTSTNYTSSTARAPAAEAKGPGGRGACGEPRGAWRRRQGRQGKIASKAGAPASALYQRPCLDANRLPALIPNGHGTKRTRRSAAQQQRTPFFRPPTHPDTLGPGRGLERGASSTIAAG